MECYGVHGKVETFIIVFRLSLGLRSRVVASRLALQRCSRLGFIDACAFVELAAASQLPQPDLGGLEIIDEMSSFESTLESDEIIAFQHKSLQQMMSEPINRNAGGCRSAPR